MNLELHLQSTERAALQADTWFIPGQASLRWLEELSRAGLAESDTRLLVIPLSTADRTVAGIVVIPGSGRRWALKPAGFPCRWIGNRLCLPADADLVPSMSPEEADSLCGDRIIFMHPSLGVSGHDPGDVLSVRQLLEPPTVVETPWNRGQSSFRLCPELTRIVLENLPTLPELFGEAAGQIASLSPQELPPTPDESVEHKPSWAGQLKDLIARQVQESRPREGHTAESAEDMSLLARWAHQRTQAEQDRLQRERFKELHRLLQQLDRDPTNGLKYAIPLNNLPHRGRTAPSGRLGERNVEFDASNLGGGPADFWSAPTELQRRLERAYVELANRELGLRNFRRAAYIYAHLLGDLVSAANALKQGGHFREAAILHEQQLRNFAEAARCLEEGELLQEAMERYEKLRLWSDLARVHEKRKDIPAAHLVWRRVVADRRAMQDHVEAAKILEEKLGAVDEAIDELRGAWPRSPQALSCLQLLLELWSKLGRNEEALRWLESLWDPSGSFWKQDAFLEIMLHQAHRQPDRRVRDAAANLIHLTVAKRLADPKTPPRVVAKLVSHLTDLAPHDRLLCRDANRYLQQRRSGNGGGSSSGLGPTDVARDSTQRKRHSAAITARFRLPWTCEWLKFIAVKAGFVGVGWKGPELVVARGSWSEGLQVNVLHPEDTKGSRRIILETPDPAGSKFWLRIGPNEPNQSILFAAAEPHFPSALTGCNPSWLDPSAYPVSCAPNGVWSVRANRKQMVLSHHDYEGRLVQTSDLTDYLIDADDAEPVCLTSFQGGVAVALQNQLVILREDGSWQPQTLPGSARSLHPDDFPGAKNLTVVLDRGIIRCDLHSAELTTVEEDATQVLFTQLDRARAVWVAGTEGCLVDLTSGDPPPVPHRFSVGTREVIAILPTDQGDHFAVIDKTGLVTLHQSR